MFSSLRHVAILYLGALLLSPLPASAQPGPKEAQQPQQSQKKAEIVGDEEKGVVRILIEGKEKAFIDANGLHVDGNITYSGNITDVGGQSTEGNKP